MTAYIYQGASKNVPIQLRKNNAPLCSLTNREIYAQLLINGTLTAIQCAIAGDPDLCDVTLPLTDLQTSQLATDPASLVIDCYISNVGATLTLNAGLVDLTGNLVEFMVPNITATVVARQVQNG